MLVLLRCFCGLPVLGCLVLLFIVLVIVGFARVELFCFLVVCLTLRFGFF